MFIVSMVSVHGDSYPNKGRDLSLIRVRVPMNADISVFMAPHATWIQQALRLNNAVFSGHYWDVRPHEH